MEEAGERDSWSDPSSPMEVMQKMLTAGSAEGGNRASRGV
jgi:hypothetical protein